MFCLFFIITFIGFGLTFQPSTCSNAVITCYLDHECLIPTVNSSLVNFFGTAYFIKAQNSQVWAYTDSACQSGGFQINGIIYNNSGVYNSFAQGSDFYYNNCGNLGALKNCELYTTFPYLNLVWSDYFHCFTTGSANTINDCYDFPVNQCQSNMALFNDIQCLSYKFIAY